MDPQVGTLTWALLIGALVANVGLVPRKTIPGLKLATKKVLRAGVVLLGFSLPFGAIVRAGRADDRARRVHPGRDARRDDLARDPDGPEPVRSLLIATGFSICGASAIAAMEENAEASEEDVAVALAMVTLWGTVAMVVLPMLWVPLGLTDVQYGAWAGASVHEVGQVVGAASAAGTVGVGVAVVVKLTRVLLLAPVVAIVSLARRRRLAAEGNQSSREGLPPIVPFFVLGFLICVGIRSLGVVPAVPSAGSPWSRPSP